MLTPMVTEIVTALNRQKQWRAAEWFLEKGKWHTKEVEERVGEMPHRPVGAGDVRCGPWTI